MIKDAISAMIPSYNPSEEYSHLEKYKVGNLVSFSLVSTIIISMIAFIFMRYNSAIEVGKSPDAFTDFDAFYTAGKLYWAGELNNSYDPKFFFAALKADAGTDIFMPWTYPPPYNFLAIAIASFDRATSYALFMAVSFTIFFGTVLRLSGNLFTIPVVLAAPAGIITIIGGQNSFVTAVLVAVFCHKMASSGPFRQAGNISLGLMAIKPHLALGLGFMLVIQKKWLDVSTVLITIFIIMASSILAFGHEIFSAFFEAVGYSKLFLQEGAYPLHRMTSVYALIYCLAGKNYNTAILIHVLVAVSALSCIWYAISRHWEISRVLALSCVVTLLVSPYNYDYDTIILAVPLSLVAQELLEFSSVFQKWLLFSFSWLTTGWGAISTFWLELFTGFDWTVYSFGGLGLIGFLIVFFSILMRAESAKVRQLESLTVT